MEDIEQLEMCVLGSIRQHRIDFVARFCMCTLVSLVDVVWTSSSEALSTRVTESCLSESVAIVEHVVKAAVAKN